MEAAAPIAGTDADGRRARFRDAVTGLAGRARSGDLLRLIVAPGAVLVVAGFCLMLLGWWGAAHTHRQIEQIPYLISGGLLGLGLVVLGGFLLATAVWMSSLERMRQQSDARTSAQLAELVAAMRPPPPEPGKAKNGSRAKATR